MIHFGTAGWRGLIGEDFTFHNVRLVTQAIANVVRERSDDDPALVIGYDTRFLSEKFATEAAKVLSHNRVRALRCVRDTPAPAIAHEISVRGASGGMNFTASHNPPEYSGLKLSDATGAPALPTLTEVVEREIARIRDGFVDEFFPSPEYLEAVDPIDGYLDRVRSHIDLDAIAACDKTFCVDVLYGTGRECLDRVLNEADVRCQVLHNFRDPYFGGYGPDVTAESLGELRELVTSSGCAAGLATDIDGDRFAVVDSDGELLNPNDVLGLLLDYVLGERGPKGDVARTVATTHLIDRVAESHGVHTHVTPVGFKYIGDLVLQEQVVFGGEESAGLTIRDHLPEKDGILACMLVAEMVARRREPLRSELERLWERVGRSHHVRHDYKLTPELEATIAGRVGLAPEALDGRPVRDVSQLDGVKLMFDDAWFLYRRSGTERLLRCYAEAPTAREAEALHEAGRRYLFGDVVAEPA